MENREINALLKKDDSQIFIEFEFCDNPKLILTENNQQQIKELFLALTNELKKEPIKIILKNDNSIEDGKSKLYIDTSIKYIEQLNRDLSLLEDSEELKKIRKITCSDTGS